MKRSKNRERTQADVMAYYQWQSLPQEEYVDKQLSGMVAWFSERKDVLDRVWLETHTHFGGPAQAFNMEAA